MDSTTNTQATVAAVRESSDGKKWVRMLERMTIAGISYANVPAGEIESLKPGEGLFIEREPTNTKDPNAIRVFKFKGRATVRLGFVPRTVARWLAPIMDAGHKVSVLFEEDDHAELYASVWIETRA